MRFYEGFWRSGKKARRAREKAQQDRVIGSQATKIPAPDSLMNMSDALVALTEPLFAEGGSLDPRDPKDRTAAFEAAQMAWNMEVIAKEGGGTAELSERLMAVAEMLHRRGSSRYAEALFELRQRKREMFPDDDRLVMEVHAYETEDGELRVTAASSLPSHMRG